MRLRPPQVHDAQLGDGAIGRGRLGQGSRLSGHVCRDQPLILEPALGRHPGAEIVIAALDGADGLLAGLVETIRRGLGRISAWHDWAPSQLSCVGVRVRLQLTLTHQSTEHPGSESRTFSVEAYRPTTFISSLEDDFTAHRACRRGTRL